jgi:hypothetical protein
MYDVEMKYCSACGDEYMPEALKCGVCGKTLLSGQEMQAQTNSQQDEFKNRRGALTPTDDIATVFKGSMADIKRIEQQLLAVNIGTLIVGDDGGCGKGCCSPEVELKIRREDGEAALKIIDSDFDNMTGAHEFSQEFTDNGFNPDVQEASCPACGFIFSTATTTCPDCGLCFG